MRRHRISFIVDAENHARAEEWGVAEGEASIIIVGIVPEALWGNTDALACYLSDNCLHDNFVGRDVEQFHLRLYLLNDVFDPGFGLSLVVLFALELLLNDIFDNVAHFWGVKSKRLILIQTYLSYSRGSSLQVFSYAGLPPNWSIFNF